MVNCYSKQNLSSVIPIVMASDENYDMPTCVAIKSILVHRKNADVHYKFYIMVDDSFSENSKQKITLLFCFHTNADIEFLNMGNYAKEFPCPMVRITAATWFRLMIPEMLSEYQKCIYLDVDIIVCDDLSELYGVDLGGNYIAGVKNLRVICDKEKFGNHHELLGIPSIEQYVNSGGILMNLEAMRRDNLTQILANAIEDFFPYADQDVINKVCYGQIHFLHPKYNFQHGIFRSTKWQERARIVYGSDEVDVALNAPVIIHYSGSVKPWDRLDNCLTYFAWYKIALTSPYGEQIFCNAVSETTIHILEKTKKWDNQKINKLKASSLKNHDKKISALQEKHNRQFENANKLHLEEIYQIEKLTKDKMADMLYKHKKEIYDLRNSTTFKIGLMVTFLPRKFLSIFKK